MKNYTDEKLVYNNITFRYSCKAEIDEREMHAYHEILYYLDGGATFLGEDFSERLERGTLLVIPAGHYHYFRAEEPENFERLKISIPESFEFSELIATEKIRIFADRKGESRALLDRICKILRDGEKDRCKCAFAYGALLVVLSGLDRAKNENVEYRVHNHLVSQIVAYIEDNLSGKLRASDIARAMNVSESTLLHTFKCELGISLHRYVTQKRLVRAQRLISENNNPTKVYLGCGFDDYSSFYKAYVRMFGHPPSKDKGEYFYKKQ